MITRIKLNKKEIKFDKILKNLQQQKDFYSSINKIFEDKNSCSINLVMNTDGLSVSESERIIEKFKEIKIGISGIVINKISDIAKAKPVKGKF